MLSASLLGIISQRLVRRICPQCIQEYPAETKDYALLGVDPKSPLTLKKGTGCSYCHHSGYKGRIAIFEIMPITTGHRQLIDKGASVDELRSFAIREGMTTLKDSAADLVLQGTTTIDELLRVTYAND